MLDMKVKTGAKRTDRRIEYPKLTAEAWTKENKHEVEVINISRKGLRFKSKEKYDKGINLMFDLNSTDPSVELSLSIKGKIVNEYSNNNEGEHEYGAKFMRLTHWYEMYRVHDFVYANITHRPQVDK